MRFLERYALSFLGLPYSWGGENPITGLDCSGLIQEIMRSVGVQPPEDMNAQGLFEYYQRNGVHPRMAFGDVAFFGTSTSGITHVGFMLDSWRMLEAGGGGSHVTNIVEAGQRNAFVRIRPISARKDLVGFARPKYPVDKMTEIE